MLLDNGVERYNIYTNSLFFNHITYTIYLSDDICIWYNLSTKSNIRLDYNYIINNIYFKDNIFVSSLFYGESAHLYDHMLVTLNYDCFPNSWKQNYKSPGLIVENAIEAVSTLFNDTTSNLVKLKYNDVNKSYFYKLINISENTVFDKIKHLISDKNINNGILENLYYRKPNLAYILEKNDKIMRSYK